MAEGNPFQDPLRFERPVPPCAVVIFGANGDLTRRKLLPALYHLACERKLPAEFTILGNSRTGMSDDEFREKMQTAVSESLADEELDPDVWRDFSQCLFYMAGDVKDPASYDAMARRLAEIGNARRTGGNTLFYLSTQPSQYERIAEGLGQAGLASIDPKAGGEDRGWRRLVVEKPFGHNLASSRELNRRLAANFPEQDLFRIDHYLGKETVQNIIAFRFGNGMFEPLWNRRYVNHVQITAAESIGVEGRGAYYQEAGALRDMIQNHLLQVTATVAMEPPAVFESEAVRDERAKVLRSIRPLKPDDIATSAVAGQYGPARIGGADVPGFRQESGVDPNAQTDTFVAATFFVDNWRWAGVPFYVRTGKRLPRRVTDIAIQFNSAPLSLFRVDGQPPREMPVEQWPNMLVLRIQPEEGISLRFISKQPGAGMNLRPVTMDFNYGTSFGVARLPRMKRCCSTLCGEMPRCTHARTWWKPVGKWWSRF